MPHQHQWKEKSDKSEESGHVLERTWTLDTGHVPVCMYHRAVDSGQWTMGSGLKAGTTGQ